MKKQQRQPAAQTLYYRLYVLYFEGPASTLKSVNKNAFYRISIWNGDEKIAEMLEGVSPVVLAKKIFLGNASLTFSQTTSHPKVKAKLWYYYKGDEHAEGQADLDLTEINEMLINNGQKYWDKHTITFSKGKQAALVLTFNMFVDRGKVELDTYIRKFKEEEQQNNRQKRIEIGRQKMSTVGQALKRTLTSVPSSLQNSVSSPKMLTMHSAAEPMAKILNFASEQPLRKLQEILRNTRNTKVASKTSLVHIEVEEQQKSEPMPIQEVQSQEKVHQYSGIEEAPINKEPMKPAQKVQSTKQPNISNIANVNSSSTYNNDLEINSALRVNNINKMRAVLEKIEGTREPSVSSQMTSFNKQNNENKTFSIAVGTVSVISDGSQASQMIANNAKETYSERAIASFKQRTIKCVNITIIICAIIMLYFLFVPRVKFSKSSRPSRIRSRRMKESVEEALLQF